MSYSPRPVALFLACLLSLLLAACGGGGDNPPPVSVAASPPATVLEVGAPLATGDVATDTFNWFNFRRQQAGMPVLVRSVALDLAAQRHSGYQQQNQIISHVEVKGNPGFSGVTVGDRLTAAGYFFNQSSAAFGEVLVATGNPLGSSPAEALLTAIYHRFIIMEPRFKEIGVGAASVAGGYTYISADLAANGFGPALMPGTVTVYPFPNQQGVPSIFYSDNESPDPVPDRNAVGYPVSVQSGLNVPLTVDSFTIQPHGGAPLPVRLLTSAVDTETPTAAAAIIPLSSLTAGTTYDVQFSGHAGSQAVQRSWSFTTA